MSLFTIAQLRAHVITDLTDDALQDLLDDAEAAIIERHGELETQTDTFDGEINATALFLKRKAQSITTVTEEIRTGDDYDETILDSTDYKLRYDGRVIERLTSGVNSRRTWGDVVTVIYVPVDEEAQRKRMAVDLVKLSLHYNALQSESVGDYKTVSVDYEKSREQILSRLKRWNFA